MNTKDARRTETVMSTLLGSTRCVLVRYSVVLLLFLMAGCGTIPQPTKSGDGSTYVLDTEITWKAATPIGMKSIWIPAGTYVATYEDDEGIYLRNKDETIFASLGSKAPEKGGIYFPFDKTKGITTYAYIEGGHFAFGTATMTSRDYVAPQRVRTRLWGPASLLKSFKPSNGGANKAPEPTPTAVTPRAIE